MKKVDSYVWRKQKPAHDVQTELNRQAGNAEGYVVPDNAEKFVPNKRLAGKQTLKRKLAGPTGKIAEYQRANAMGSGLGRRG